MKSLPRSLTLAAAASLIVAGVAAIAAPAPAKAQARAPEPAKAIDAARFYTGRWHELARRPMKITDGCVAGATTYTPGDKPGRITVRDTCQKGTPTGEEKAISGKGVIQDPGTNAKLKVRYALVIVRDYWVLDRAEDYSWFISGDPKLKDLYIFARDPQTPKAQLDALVGKARAMGYDVSKLEFPPQPAR